MEVWTSTPVLTGLVAVTVVAAAALAFGGSLERRGAGWIWAAWVMTPLLQALTGEFDPALLFGVVDATMLVVLAGLAWRSNRTWPVAAVAAQALSLAIDLLRLVVPMGSYVYVTALTVSAYALLAALAAGTWTSWRRRRAAGLGIPS
ncbi:MAG: hypothetical protein INR64_01060 [Caulobacteraceae bacterium]|nr:hypothetical protein [Caulobacter sp.]